MRELLITDPQSTDPDQPVKKKPFSFLYTHPAKALIFLPLCNSITAADPFFADWLRLLV